MGIYVHVPFCHSKCVYCGFYSTVSPLLQDDWCKALETEAGFRGRESGNVIFPTLYLGGGTPSSLPPALLERTVRAVEDNFVLKEGAERTIEANPEDISIEKVRLFRGLGFNRISIGVQSFDDRVLAGSSRRHSSLQAEQAIETAFAGGFNNICMDLIIGLSGDEKLERNIGKTVRRINSLPVSHLSLYALSLEEGSILYRKVEKGRFKMLPDDVTATLYLEYADALRASGFSHYEISNFARNGMESVHNNLYWDRKPYVGLGPAAHSYDGASVRRWNVANLKKYMGGVLDGSYYEQEYLTAEDRYNETIMTCLRRKRGMTADIIASDMVAPYWEQVRDRAESYVRSGHAEYDGMGYRLTEEGWLVSDSIFRELFVDAE